MWGNTANTLFRVTTFGESHGPALGVVIDGCPAGLRLDMAAITAELDRRRPGQSKVVTQRQETDEFELLSGTFDGVTTGTPLAFLIRNLDQRSKDYDAIKDSFRPGHADFTYFAKYGIRDYRGGGRASARETAARVLAGAVAKQLLGAHGITFVGGLVQLGGVRATARDWDFVSQNDLNCTDAAALEAMFAELDAVRKDRDSIGGVVEVQALGVPPGLGEPVFAKLDASIGAAMFSIPAVKAVEIGLGAETAARRGSEVNDEMFPDGFGSNAHGGVLGGISSGAPIVVRLSLKPTSSIPREKNSVNERFEEIQVLTKGRHDPCVAIRAVPIAEAMLALVVIDAFMQQLAQDALRAPFSPHSLPQYGLRK
jgi:chorismate synthase